jgi:hypothetical protein
MGIARLAHLSPLEREVAAATVAPLEVDEPPRFRDEVRRSGHVRKHVVEAREERWQQILGQDAVTAARDADRAGEPVPQAAADGYEQAVAAVLVDASRCGCGHLHLAEVEPGPDGRGFRAVRQTVRAWDTARRIVAVATVFAGIGRQQRWVLRTGYRELGRIGAAAFARKQRRRAMEEARVGAVVLLAIHDPETLGG